MTPHEELTELARRACDDCDTRIHTIIFAALSAATAKLHKENERLQKQIDAMMDLMGDEYAPEGKP